MASASAFACALIWLSWGVYLYWNDIRLVNFLAAWIPFALSTLLAFVPEHKMNTTKKIVWRSRVITVGFIWSVVLWHQQVVTDMTARHEQERIVTEAITKSTEHSDQEIGKVSSEVTTVRNDLKETTRSITGLLSRSAADINSSIGKVGKPEPLELVRLEASLWAEHPGTSWPISERTISPDKDGVFSVDWTFRNVSGVAANNADIWIQICDNCAFAIEPAEFDRPKGLSDTMRHRFIQLLNPGTTVAKMTVMIKSNKPFSRFEIMFLYSCQACGKVKEGQKLIILEPAS